MNSKETPMQNVQDATVPSTGKNLAKTFSRLGWIGFWLQVVFGSVPVIGMAIYVFYSHPNPDAPGGIGFSEVLTVINMVIVLFTAFWSFRYTRLGKRLADPQRSPSQSSLIRAVWTGVVAITAGMLASMIVILIETANLLFYFLKSPQAGIPVIQTSGAGATYWVSSIDMLSLMASVLFVFAELIVLIFSLWLLFRTTQGLSESSAASPGQA
jgi:hypothetical protein